MERRSGLGRGLGALIPADAGDNARQRLLALGRVGGARDQGVETPAEAATPGHG